MLLRRRSQVLLPGRDRGSHPEGLVAIESLREGDLVIARDEDTGQSGVFPVTALMSRQATDTIWLTLERSDGAVSRMGVTSEHPLFTVGEGWLSAGDLAPGDAIRDSSLQELTVLAVERDTAPRIVHNLEVAGAHTYFAGELEAWGHNNSPDPKFNQPKPPSPSQVTVNGVCFISNFPNDHGPAHVHVSGGGPNTRMKPDGVRVDETDAKASSKKKKACKDPRVRRLLRNAAKWVKYNANK